MDDTKYDKIRNYLEGDAAETDGQVGEWLGETPPGIETERALGDFWNRLPEWDEPHESRRAFERFCRTAGPFAAPSRPWTVRLGRMTRNAAAVLLIPVAMLSMVLLQRPPVSDVEWCEFAVGAGQTDSLVLPDRSCVWLNAGSRLIYPRQFDGRVRKVFLSGEAYFDVARDTGHPFVVGAGDIRVRVLGTQFNVTSYENMESVSVCLVEGSVRLDIEKDGLKRNMLLAPGDVARYDKVSGALEQRRLPAEAYLSWRNGGFYFNNQSLSEIAAQFERVFGIKIHIADRHAAATHYTLAFVNGESLDRMLEAIAADELRIRREGEMIVIDR